MGCRTSFTILNPLFILLLALCTKGCVEIERLALLDFKASFTSSSQNQGKLSSWKNASECCSWEGISCDNHSKHVVSLDLSYEGLESNQLRLPSLVELQHLRRLDLSWNDQIATRIPEFIGSLGNSTNNLEILTISGNRLEDGIFNTIGNLCNLRELEAYECISNESFVNIVKALSSTCASRSLELMDLSSMNLTGTIPSMLNFQSLTTLILSHNCLDNLATSEASNISSKSFMDVRFLNTLPLFPANLRVIYLGNNNLNGVLSDVHFTNFSQLQELTISHNPNLTFSFNKSLLNAIMLDLRSCNLGPNFPSGLLALNNISLLDISNCKISGTIPTMFWMNLSPSITYLNLSSNSLTGVVPNISFEFTYPSSFVDLSSNAFSGPIPFFLFTANGLKLSNNKFSGFAPIPHPFHFSSSPIPDFSEYPIPPKVVDLSNNNLSGLIPRWLGIQKSLGGLILANNNLSGTIPTSIEQAIQLYVLNLRNNNFSGPIPSSLKNCSELRILDLGSNHFSGFIPSWMGENLKNLSILSLGTNSLMGILPTNLCHLSFLQILDVSHNLLSGNIPYCIHDLTAMTHATNISLKVFNFETDNYAYIEVPIEEVSYYNAYIKWKRKVWKFQSNLHLVKLIDLSSNNLSGETPTGLTSLVELDSIDLSGNSLQGSMPEQIGQLKSLQYLNLSSNRLCGQIPQSLSEIFALEMLDLSHNNLSGRIPKGTQLQSFDPSAFDGNTQLCGLPLRKCHGDRDDSVQSVQPSPTNDNEMQENWADNQWFYAGLGAGFACGFFGILGTLNWIRKWRISFFEFATHLGEWILLVVALNMSKISRKLGFK